MATGNDTRRSTTTTSTPLLALIGATDLTVERVRLLLAEAEKALGDYDRTSPQDTAQHTVALARAMAARAEARYAELAQRGQKVLDRVASQRATQDLLSQGKVTLSRTRAAVTTASKAATATANAARDTVTTARREAAGAAEQTATAVRGAGRSTQASAERTVQTGRSGAAETRTRAKAARTSARKTTAAARKAAEDAAEKVGD